MDALGCPLTLKYLAALQKRIEETGYLDHLLPRLGLLEELANCAGNDRVRLHQRAFLCVEIMATRGISSAYNIGVPHVAVLRWPKSAAGIAKLLKVARAEKDELLAGQVEYVFEGAMNQPVGADQLYYARAKRQVDYLTHLEAAAMLLRRSLRRGFIHQSLSALGKPLFEVTYMLGWEAQLDIAQELLDQTENVERRAWDPKIQSRT